MLDKQKLQSVKTIVVHANCSDGLASAIFCLNVLPKAKVLFLQYSTVEHDGLEPEPGMLFCDITPHPSKYQEFVKAGALVLDHHKTARPIVKAFGDNGVFGDEDKEPGISGAVLAYREVWCQLRGTFHNGEAEFAGETAHLVGTRDTWQRTSPEWEKSCILSGTLRFYPESFWLEVARKDQDLFSPSHMNWWNDLKRTGEIYIDKMKDAVEKAVEKSYHFTTSQGTRVVIFSGVSSSSDAAEMLQENADLVVGFDYVGMEEGLAVLVFSLRSHTNFDCGKFCKSLGGGGHTKAAGFSVKFDPSKGQRDPYTTFREILSNYET